MKEPNATCRVCGKPYYVCNFCTRVNNYKTIACSQECFDQYVQSVLDKRAEDNKKFRDEYIGIYSSRHDMTQEQYMELMAKPIEQVIEETKVELKEYIDKYPNISIVEIVSIINKEIEDSKINDRVKNEEIQAKEVTQETVTPTANKPRKKRSRR